MRELSHLVGELERNNQFVSVIGKTCDALEECIRRGNKILIAGNGGSAADSQHFAAELMSRYMIERDPIRAMALSTDTSILTAVANDYGFENIFMRQLEGLGDSGDVFVALTTSGRSRNIINGIIQSKKMGILTVALCGNAGLDQGLECDIMIRVTSDSVPRIQELHGLAIHCICHELEQRLYQ
ncbi:SIS domain-containing protein [Cyanobium sp. Alchichica 3B3-8F6]|uniref:D-sedoheptulose-7-phosphate isomerase n=1 Tax=Cyanobium sp. Alchichica 3B3-8F6 TaxID=2823696 RepID=UPI0020CF8518|nr:SIS domain-containing protein [Cyanobium sp. Alchichica 3B3-8F6]